MWCFEVIDPVTNQVLLSDKGFISEYEAEYYATIDIKANGIKSFYIRTYPEVAQSLSAEVLNEI